VRASEPVLGITGARHKERELPLAALETLSTQGPDKLIEFLKDEPGRSVSALTHALDEINVIDEHKQQRERDLAALRNCLAVRSGEGWRHRRNVL